MQSGSNSLPYEIMYAKYGPSYWRSHEKVSGNLDIKLKKIIACVVTLSLYFSCSFAIQQPFNLAEKYSLKIRKVSINNSQVYLLYFYSVFLCLLYPVYLFTGFFNPSLTCTENKIENITFAFNANVMFNNKN